MQAPIDRSRARSRFELMNGSHYKQSKIGALTHRISVARIIVLILMPLAARHLLPTLPAVFLLPSHPSGSVGASGLRGCTLGR